MQRCGKNGHGMVRVGLLKRAGAGTCPNLLQRRPGPGSTTDKARNINDSISALWRDPGLCNRFG